MDDSEMKFSWSPPGYRATRFLIQRVLIFLTVYYFSLLFWPHSHHLLVRVGDSLSTTMFDLIQAWLVSNISFVLLPLPFRFLLAMRITCMWSVGWLFSTQDGDQTSLSYGKKGLPLFLSLRVGCAREGVGDHGGVRYWGRRWWTGIVGLTDWCWDM